MRLEEPARELAYATPAKDRFLRGKTPKELRRKGAPDARKATDGDLVEYLSWLSERLYYSLYWTVFRYEAYLEDHGRLGRLDYDSLLLDTLFLEIEHQECGVLCAHTMEEGKHFLDWCRQQTPPLDPVFVYSGGKSLHVYLFFDENSHDVTDKHKHETVKAANNRVAKLADLKLYDPVVARTGRSQVARLPGARNSDTGYFCNLVATPGNYKEFDEMKVNDVITLAKNKNEDTLSEFLRWRDDIKEYSNQHLGNLVEMAEEEAKEKLARQSTSGGMGRGGGGGGPVRCSTVDAIMGKRPKKGTRYYHAMVLIDYYLGDGDDPETVVKKLLRWNQKNRVGLSTMELKRAVWNRVDQGDYNKRPCRWLRCVDIMCPQCDAAYTSKGEN